MAAAPGLVWLASFPKSGNTWFRLLLANLAAGGDDPADINAIGQDGFAADREAFEAATMLETGLLSDDDIDALRPRFYEQAAADAGAPRWMKVHDGYTLLPSGEPLLGATARAAIYLARDPRDVAVSLAHHNGSSIDAAITTMNRTDSLLGDRTMGGNSQLRQKLGSWSDHVAGWLDQRHVSIQLVRYEDLLSDPVTRFGEALAFAGHDAGPDEIARAVRHVDFVNLQSQERATGFAEGGPAGAPFFRVGRSGAWREVLTDDQRARIEGAHAEVMERLGYARN